MQHYELNLLLIAILFHLVHKNIFEQVLYNSNFLFHIIIIIFYFQCGSASMRKSFTPHTLPIITTNEDCPDVKYVI